MYNFFNLDNLDNIISIIALIVSIFAIIISIRIEKDNHKYEHLLGLQDYFPLLTFINIKKYDDKADKFYIIKLNLNTYDEDLIEESSSFDDLGRTGYSFANTEKSKDYFFTFQNTSNAIIHKVTLLSFAVIKQFTYTKFHKPDIEIYKPKKIDYAFFEFIDPKKSTKLERLKYFITYKLKYKHIKKTKDDYGNMLSHLLYPEKSFHFFLNFDANKIDSLYEFQFIFELTTLSGLKFYERVNYSFNNIEYEYSHKKNLRITFEL